MKNVFLILSLVAIAFLLWLNYAPKDKRAAGTEVIYTEEAPRPIGPYSQAIKAGNVVFLSGQIGISPSGVFDTASIEAETRQVMQNLEAVLRAAHLTFKNVVKATIYLTDLGHFSMVNNIYGGYFAGGNPPARETVQVAALPKGARVEISMIAVE